VSYIELCRFGTKKAANYVEEQLQIPGDVCSMVKVMLGEMHFIGREHAQYIHSYTGTCEPFNLAFELLEKEGFKVKYQESPLGVAPDISDEKYDKLYRKRVDEIDDMARWISGKPIDKDCLKLELERFNRTLKKVNTINNLRKRHKTYLANLPAAYIILGIGNYFSRPDEYEEILDLFIDELSKLPEGTYDDDVVPLIWSGARSVDFGICHALDLAGGILLDWNVPTGLHNYFAEDEDPVDAVAHYTMGYHGKKVEKERMGPGFLSEMIKEQEARGVIFYNYMGCPMCAVNTSLTGSYVSKNLNLPIISLDGSFPTEPPTGQLLTRVEAFVEML
jgi:benzoyl-CoA reductase/2-hydroxyglutaryl-CoA dehydratase subunit BcrC/BadD/HgdB